MNSHDHKCQSDRTDPSRGVSDVLALGAIDRFTPDRPNEPEMPALNDEMDFAKRTHLIQRIFNRGDNVRSQEFALGQGIDLFGVRGFR